MRFDTPIYFQQIVEDYDASTGDYGLSSLTETMRRADVTNAGVNTLNLVYGELRQGCLTLRLQRHYNAPFDRIRIGEKLYRVDFSRTLRNVQTFVVSEVQ